MTGSQPPVYESLGAFADEPGVFTPNTELDRQTDPQDHVLGWFEDELGDRTSYLAWPDYHPGGYLAAQQIDISWTQSHGGVWDAASGKLIWELEETRAVCWSATKDQLLLIRSHSEPDPHHASSMFRMHTHYFERWGWPDRSLIDRCEIWPPMGWFDRVLASPRGDLAAVRWMEQHASGFLLVDMSSQQVKQRPLRYLQTRRNAVNGPIFSADGRYLVLSFDEVIYGDPRDGNVSIGSVWIYDIDFDVLRDIGVAEDRRQDTHYWIGKPRFVTADEFVVRLSTGTERRFSVRG